MSRTRGVLGFLLAGSLAVLAAVALGRAGAESSRNAGANYGIATDPEAVVMRLEYRGGMALGSGAVYTLTGDGGLVKEELVGKRRRQRHELTVAQVDELVRLAVEGGLIELDWPSLRARLEAMRGPGTAGTDLPTFILEVGLEHYRDSAGVERGETRSKFSCVCGPSYLAIDYPDVPEVVALDTLTKALLAPFDPRGKP